MKIIAYYALHYGREYLKWSIRSILPYVDEVDIFYTPRPSFGHWTKDKCPESKEDISLSIAEHFADNGKVFWHEYDRQFSTEGLHRDHCFNYVVNKGADIVLPVDADEIYTPKVMEKLLETVSNGNFRIYRINMMHFWRSFKWVCYDAACPVRAIDVRVPSGEEAYVNNDWKCWHFGYAQTPKIVEYKAKIHGHLAEWRPDWFENKFMNWSEGVKDVHPTNKDYWDPVLYNYYSDSDFELLLHDHPYYRLSIDYLISNVMYVLWNSL